MKGVILLLLKIDIGFTTKFNLDQVYPPPAQAVG